MSKQTRFETAYAAWLAAVAAVWAHHKSEAAMAAALNAENRAEWTLIRTPAGQRSDVMQRAVFVQSMMTAAAERGTPTDNRIHAAMAVLVAEISCGSSLDAGGEQ